MSVALVIGVAGCRTPAVWRRQADKAAYRAIEKAREQALGQQAAPFAVERPSDTFRRRLFEQQDLPISDPAFLGLDTLPEIRRWPDRDYLKRATLRPPDWFAAESDEAAAPAGSKIPVLTLIDALQAAAYNSREYQNRKEALFAAALGLDLEAEAFRGTLGAMLRGEISSDLRGDEAVSGATGRLEPSFSRRLAGGSRIAASLTVDLVKLLTQSRASSWGLRADTGVTIPLGRGAGRHIAREPLTQAEFDLLYAVWEFERFKQGFSVQIANAYFNVLAQRDQVDNAEDNYRRLLESARRTRQLAAAGRLPEIQADQAAQDELRARNRWIAARQAYARQLDNFKLSLGLPPDAELELDDGELEQVSAFVRQRLPEAFTDLAQAEEEEVDFSVPVAAGPLEMAEATALELAFEHRHDLRIAQSRVYDAQRKVVVAADQLKIEATLGGSGAFGEGRGLAGADSENARLRPEEGVYSSFLSLDFPWRRTAERNRYRQSLINLERALREAQDSEDQVKVQVRNQLRNLQEARETLRIQSQAVRVASRRVESTDLFLEAGRAAIRDVLEAQEALISARNSLTAAIVAYRMGELELQRDLGVLQVAEDGLWREFEP